MSRGKRIPVYVSDEEYELVNAAAHASRLSMSAWARKTLADVATAEQQRRGAPGAPAGGGAGQASVPATPLPASVLEFDDGAQIF